MLRSCSFRSPIRYASKRLTLLVWLVATPRLWAQIPDEARVGDFARLLAASDARVYDGALLSATLRSEDAKLRRQAALAAGRIGDPAALELLVAALGDSDIGVRAAAAFSLGLLKDGRAVPELSRFVASVSSATQDASHAEAAVALDRIGTADAATAIREVLGSGATPGVGTSPAQSAALLDAWRLGARAPIASIVAYADDPDATVRAHALYALGRLRAARGAAALVNALEDQDPTVRAIAVKGITPALLDSARIARHAVADRMRPLLADTSVALRVNALRALAAFKDSGLTAIVAPLANDANANVAVQAETTLGVLRGSMAVQVLEGKLANASFARRRQAAIALAEADSAKGVASAAPLAGDLDWRWRSVAAEAFGAARDRAHLEAQLTDPDGRVVAQALQCLMRIVPERDSALAARARGLLEHQDAAVRSSAADILARVPRIDDVEPLTRAYLRAGGDAFNDARLSAVSALAAIAQASADGRVRVASRFVGSVPRPDDYLVRRIAAARLPDAYAAWGPVSPIATGRTDADYRDIVRRYLLPALDGSNPRITIETDAGSLEIELLAAEAPMTVAAFLSLVDQRYFDGSRWHRVVPNFVVQDGDPRGDGWGGPGFVLRDELNLVRYDVGVVGVALSGPDTGGSQFFITHSAQPHLDGTYTAFGRVAPGGGGAAALAGIAQGDRIRSIHR